MPPQPRRRPGYTNKGPDVEAITRAPPPMPDIDVFADRYRQLLGGFNVYCSTPSVADAVLPPRVQ